MKQHIVTVITLPKETNIGNGKYVRISIENSYGTHKIIIFEELEPDLFEQIEYAIHGKTEKDLPITTHVMLSGIIKTVRTPRYYIKNQ